MDNKWRKSVGCTVRMTRQAWKVWPVYGYSMYLRMTSSFTCVAAFCCPQYRNLFCSLGDKRFSVQLQRPSALNLFQAKSELGKKRIFCDAVSVCAYFCGTNCFPTIVQYTTAISKQAPHPRSPSPYSYLPTIWYCLDMDIMLRAEDQEPGLPDLVLAHTIFLYMFLHFSVSFIIKGK